MEVTLVLQKILSIFLMIFAGFFAYKIKWLPKEAEKYLSLIMINISGTCLIFYSMQSQETNAETMTKAAQALILMCIAIVIACVISIFLVRLLRVKVTDRGVYRLMIAFTNCGFMGYPLAEAAFGSEGLFLAIVANMGFNIMIFSVGAFLLIYDLPGHSSMLDTLKKIISLPLVVCIIGLFIFFLDIKFPPLIADTCDLMGAMTAPLAMMIVGMQLAQSNFLAVVKNIRLLLMCVFRLVLIPVVLFGMFFKLSFIHPLVFCVVIYAMCMPSAAYTSVLANRYGGNTVVAAEGIFLSTLFSLFTLPTWGALLNIYLAGV